MKRAFPLLFLALAACAGAQPWAGEWSRSQTPGRTLDADLSDCRSEAAEGVARAGRIDDDTTRQRDQTRDAYGGALIGDLRRFDTTRTFNEGVDRCMRNRGYAPVGLTR